MTFALVLFPTALTPASFGCLPLLRMNEVQQGEGAGDEG
jgi:hypothetical protein